MVDSSLIYHSRLVYQYTNFTYYLFLGIRNLPLPSLRPLNPSEILLSEDCTSSFLLET